MSATAPVNVTVDVKPVLSRWEALGLVLAAALLAASAFALGSSQGQDDCESVQLTDSALTCRIDGHDVDLVIR